MDSHELANAIVPIQARALQRILVEGKESYSQKQDTQQDFEFETMEHHLTDLEEELLDVMNWAALTIIKLRRRKNRLAEAHPAP